MQTLLLFIDRRWRELSVFICLIVTATSLIPLDELPPIAGPDKFHHLLAYGLLMFPAALRKPHAWRLLAVGYFTWSGVIELVQPLVNRHAEWLDLLANATGLLCAILIAEIVRTVVDS